MGYICRPKGKQLVETQQAAGLCAADKRNGHADKGRRSVFKEEDSESFSTTFGSSFQIEQGRRRNCKPGS